MVVIVFVQVLKKGLKNLTFVFKNPADIPEYCHQLPFLVSFQTHLFIFKV